MVNFLQSVRALVGLVLFVVSLLITFDGFPGALLSWLGGGVVTLGYTVAIANITHEDTGNGKQGPGTRFILICIAFAVASFGKAIVMWGDTNVVLFDFVINFVEVGVILGIVSGLFNIDKRLIRAETQQSQNNLLPSFVNWFKQMLKTLGAAHSYMNVSDDLKASIDRRINQRSKSLLKNEIAASRQEADCLASAETAAMLINEMMTFRLKNTHSDLQEYIGKHQNEEWYWTLILKQIISLTHSSLASLSESRAIACIKFRTSLPFELLKQNPSYQNKTVTDILCSSDGVELTFRCLLDESSNPEQLKKDSVDWFCDALKHELELNQKGNFIVDPEVINNILRSALNIDCGEKPKRPSSGWQTPDYY